MPGPPDALVRTLVEGPSLVRAVDWRDEVASTQALAAEAARAGAPEIHLVLADTQTAGRGRLGRSWHAPPGTSLLASFVLRPAVGPDTMRLLPLLAGLALADVAERYCPRVSLKWPNDVLLGERKAAGLLAEGPLPDGAVVLGMGVNVDWRGLARPPDAPEATSLAEAAGSDVDRWRVLAAFVGVFGRRYLDWQQHPADFLDSYRSRCATLGRRVTVARPQGKPVRGLAHRLGPDGALEVRDDAGAVHRLLAGDVAHVRPA